MAAGKVSRLSKGFGYGDKSNVGCGRKRGLFECNVEVKVKGKKSMEISEVVEGSNPLKKRGLSHVVCGEGGDEGVKIRPSLVVGRGSSFDDGEVVDSELDQEGFSGAMNVNVNVLMSRWGCDDVLEVSGEERSLSVESGVTQREGSSSSKDGDEGGYLVRGVEVDDCMEVDVCEGRDSGGIGARRCMLESCRSVCDEYDNVGKISEGAYGVVYKARGKKSRELVALKKLKLGDEKEGFPGHFLREINVILSINHPSIVNVREVVLDERGHGLGDVYLAMDYVEHDLQRLMEVRKRGFSQSEVKCLMLQLLEGVNYLHDNWLIHRDLKTSNLLYNNQGELKICDFGMSRQYGSSPLKPYTALVVTLWYRAPELLLGAKKYSTAVDMWSVGCIMAELLTSKPFFEGKNELDQLDKIFRKLGTPNEKIWPDYPQLPGVKVNFVHQPYNLLHKEFPRASFTSSPTLSDLGLDLLSRLLTYDPEKRITAEEALNHRWFQEVPLPTAKEFMPTFPAAPRVS